MKCDPNPKPTSQSPGYANHLFCRQALSSWEQTTCGKSEESAMAAEASHIKYVNAAFPTRTLVA